MNSVIDVSNHVNTLQNKLKSIEKNGNEFERASELINILSIIFADTILFVYNIDNIVLFKSPEHMVRLIGPNIVKNDLLTIQDTLDEDKRFPVDVKENDIVEIIKLGQIMAKREKEIIEIEFNIPNWYYQL